MYGVLLLLGTFHAMANVSRKPKPPPAPLIKNWPKPVVPEVYIPTTFEVIDRPAPPIVPVTVAPSAPSTSASASVKAPAAEPRSRQPLLDK